MYVRNIAGFDISIRYTKDVEIKIPNDGYMYSVPDDMKVFPEYLQVIRPFNVKSQPVTYIKKDGEVSDTDAKKRSGRPPNEVDEDQPLKGVSLEKDKDGEPKRKRGRPRKNPADTKPKPKKKRGRPAKRTNTKKKTTKKKTTPKKEE